MMTSQILVPLDGSALAERALACAVMLAQGLSADLVLFRAVSVPPDLTDVLRDVPQGVEAQMEQLEAGACEYLSQVASRLKTLGLNVRTVVEWGPAAEEIVDYAEQEDIQQIVMATHGYSGISRWRHGSVAERVLQSASVPVLLVRAGEKMQDDIQQAMQCQRIMVPLDGSSVAEQVLPPVISVARAIDAEIVLFRVPIAQITGSLSGDWCLPLEGTLDTANGIASVYLKRMAEHLQQQGIKVSTAMRMGGVANVIIEFAEANAIDLIAMCTHGRTGLARWALGSVTDRVLRAGHIPLFLVRAR
jgi:nucleotide-binding universal stress UspA family protein